MRAEEDYDAFFSQAIEAADEAKATYYRPQMKRRLLTTDDTEVRAM